MVRFRSARDIGLITRWRYGFVPYQTRATTTAGVVYIDVGGELSGGVLDHHATGAGFESSAAIVAGRPDLVYTHLLEPWLRRADEGRLPAGTVWEPLLITHEHPDWDAAVTCYLIEQLIEFGTLPAETAKLVQYTNEVDQGRRELDAELGEPHLALLAAADLHEKEHGRVLARGIELVRAHLNGGWRERPEFADLRRHLGEQQRLFELDSSNAHCIENFPIPEAGTGAMLHIPAFLLREPSQCALNKEFVRGKYPLFLCPYEKEGARLFVISLTPDWRTADNRRPSLEGLGAALEREEIRARVALHGHDDRPGPPRWEDGVCTNSDPWYDGRDREYSLVQTPHGGTLLTIEQVRKTLEEAKYAAVPLEASMVHLVWRGDVVLPAKGLGDLPLRSAVKVLAEDLPKLLVVELSIARGTVLERAVEWKGRIGQAIGGEPAYVLARIAPAAGAISGTTQAGLRALGSGRLRPISPHSESGCLANAHNVLHLVKPGKHRDEEEVKAFLYAALLRESLAAFSTRLADGGVAKADAIRRDFLQFQARHYRHEVSSHGPAQDTFDTLAKEMELPRLYQEVEWQLRRLAEMEQQASQGKFEILVFVLSALSFLQTVTAYFGLNYKEVDGRLLGTLSLGFPVMFVLVFCWTRGWLRTVWLVVLAVLTMALGAGIVLIRQLPWP